MTKTNADDYSLCIGMCSSSMSSEVDPRTAQSPDSADNLLCFFTVDKNPEIVDHILISPHILKCKCLPESWRRHITDYNTDDGKDDCDLEEYKDTNMDSN